MPVTITEDFWSDTWSDTWPGVLFFTAPGIQPTEPSETACLLSHPSLSYDFDRVRNVVEVLGAKPEKGIKRIRAIARAHPSHPLSPEKLARNGQPRFMVEVIENDLSPRTKTQERKNEKGRKVEYEQPVWESVIKKRKRARAIARRRLDQLLRSLLDAEYEILPHPHIEVMDMVRVKSSTAGNFNHTLKTYSLPLTAGPGQSIGRNKKLRSKSKRKARVRASGGNR